MERSCRQNSNGLSSKKMPISGEHCCSSSQTLASYKTLLTVDYIVRKRFTQFLGLRIRFQRGKENKQFSNKNFLSLNSSEFINECHHYQAVWPAKLQFIGRWCSSMLLLREASNIFDEYLHRTSQEAQSVKRNLLWIFYFEYPAAMSMPKRLLVGEHFEMLQQRKASF